MGAGHSHRYYVHAHTPLHRMAPEAKLVAVIVFVFAVVATPREAFWAFGADAVLLALVAAVGGLRPGRVLRRMVIEVPFLAFAVFLPLLGGGERTEVWGLSLSVAGLWGAWNIVVKGSLGVAAAIVLTSTTTAPEILRGLDRLRLPAILVQITSFMIRYLDVIADDLRRMRIARESRGADPRAFARAKAIATSAGALFIRSFERGERIQVAMIARGFDGRFPRGSDRPAPGSDWCSAASMPVLALLVCSLAWGIQ